MCFFLVYRRVTQIAFTYLDTIYRLKTLNGKAKCARTKDKLELSYPVQIYCSFKKLNVFHSNSIAIPADDQLWCVYKVRKGHAFVIKSKYIMIIIALHMCSTATHAEDVEHILENKVVCHQNLVCLPILKNFYIPERQCYFYWSNINEF